MKVYLIRPKAPPTLKDLSEGLSWWGHRASLAPVELATLSALAPEGVELSILDAMTGDPVDYECSADVVVVFARPAQIPSLRYLVGRFRARKIPVAIGGTYISRYPNQAGFADIKLIGDPECVWTGFLNGWLEGGTDVRRIEVAKCWDLADAPTPRWDAVDLSRYRMGVVEVMRRSFAEAGSGRGAIETERVSCKPLEKVEAEIVQLTRYGVRRIMLGADDLLEDEDYARSLLERLSKLHSGTATRPQFETRLEASRLDSDRVAEWLRKANVRRVVLDGLGNPSADGNLESGLSGIDDASRRLRSLGIRVAAPLNLDCNRESFSWKQLEGTAKRLVARTWVEAVKALPGSELHERLKEDGRLVVGARDSEFRHELFDLPNFELEGLSRAELGKRVREFVLEAHSLQAMSERLRGLLRDAKSAPKDDTLPPPDDLVAFVRMLAGTFQNPGEARMQASARALVGLLLEHPPVEVWSQGLEALLEEVAARSFVVKISEGRPLDAAQPSKSWKEHLLSIGSKGLGAIMASRLRDDGQA